MFEAMVLYFAIGWSQKPGAMPCIALWEVPGFDLHREDLPFGPRCLKSLVLPVFSDIPRQTARDVLPNFAGVGEDGVHRCGSIRMHGGEMHGHVRPCFAVKVEAASGGQSVSVQPEMQRGVAKMCRWTVIGM